MKNISSISKLNAAKQQLETCISLYFNNEDPVSIHTLASAAYNVIRDVNNKRHGNPMILKGLLIENVKPDKKSLVINKMNEAENFFKHADKDPDHILTFDSDLTDFYILDACVTYKEISGESPPLFILFRSWMILINPEIFTTPNELNQLTALTAKGRKYFFKIAMPQVLKSYS